VLVDKDVTPRIDKESEGYIKNQLGQHIPSPGKERTFTEDNSANLNNLNNNISNNKDKEEVKESNPFSKKKALDNKLRIKFPTSVFNKATDLNIGETGENDANDNDNAIENITTENQTNQTTTISIKTDKKESQNRNSKKRNSMGFSSINKKNKLGSLDSEKSSDRDSSAERFSKMNLEIDDINNLYTRGGGEKSDQELTPEEEYKKLEMKIKQIAKHCVDFMQGTITECNYTANNFNKFPLSDDNQDVAEVEENRPSNFKPQPQSVKGGSKNKIIFTSLTDLQEKIVEEDEFNSPFISNKKSTKREISLLTEGPDMAKHR